VLFHGAGGVLTALAGVVALFAYVMAAWSASTCGDEAAEPAALAGLRLSIVVIGVVFALVPGGWALIARASRFHWLTWATVAAMAPVAAIGVAIGTDEVGTWCLY
jgi:hypothetical protein